MTPYHVQKAASEFGISYKSAARMRIRYLLDVIDQWVDYICEDTDVMPPYTIVDATNEIAELKRYANRKPRKGDITDDMIAAAKEYPIEQLVEFTRGVALAWCHDDTRPSLSLDRKRNRCRCFVCNKSFNPLDVLIDRDGRTFAEAVRELG